MPQLDKASYFSQIFWLLVIFTTFYAIIIRIYLPRLARIMKLRQKTLKYGRSLTRNIYKEQEIILDEKPLVRALEEGRNSLIRTVASTNKWYNDTEKQLQATPLRGVNNFYLTSMALSPAQQYTINKRWCESNGRGAQSSNPSKK